MDAQQVNLSDDELTAAVQAGWLDNPATLNKLDSDSRRRLVRVRGSRPTDQDGHWEDRGGFVGKTWVPANGASDRTRVDTNSVGIDHDAIMHGIANWASKLHPSLQRPAAMLATFPADALESLVEMLSAPESVATMGAAPAMRAMDAAGPAIATGAKTVATGTGRLASAAIDAADPDLVAIASPRAGAALKKAQQVRDALQARAARTPPPSMPEPALPTAPPAAPSAPRTINDAMAEAMRARRAPSAPDASVPAAPTAPRARSRAPRPRGAASPSPNLGQANPEFAPVGGESAYNAANPAAQTPDAAARVYDTMMAKNHLSAAETQLFLKLRQAGKSDAEAFATIDAARKLSTGLPNDAQVRSAVADRNATGRWREE